MKIKKAFTLIELLVVIAIIAILAALLLPSLAKSKEYAKRVECVNNIRQLGMAVTMYADDSDGKYPLRAGGVNNFWPIQLSPYFAVEKVLNCPDDPNPKNFGDGSANSFLAAKRSYIFNGFDDYFQGSPPPGSDVPESAVQESSETILFGEKDSSSGHWWMDYWMGDDYNELDQMRHVKGSNYSFADGSSRYLLFGQSLVPVNLWFVNEDYRKLGISL